MIFGKINNEKLNKLAANPRVARDNYFYGGFINFFFLQFKLI